MAIAAVLALFPVLFLFNPRLAVASLLVAIVVLYRQRVNRERKKSVRREEPPREQREWKDPWSTEGLGQ